MITSPLYSNNMNKNTSPVTLTAEQLRQAADLADNIAKQQNELTSLLTGQPIAFSSASKNKGGNRFTPAQRKAISEGQKRKWAERKALASAGQAPTVQAPSPIVTPQSKPAVASVPVAKAA